MIGVANKELDIKSIGQCSMTGYQHDDRCGQQRLRYQINLTCSVTGYQHDDRCGQQRFRYQTKMTCSVIGYQHDDCCG